MPSPIRTTAALGAAAIALSLAACGSSDSTTSSSTPAASTPAASSSDGSLTETLSNFKISGPSTAKAGSVSFSVKNSAQIEHEMVVIKTDTSAAKIKVSGGKASEKGSVGEVEVAGGASKTLKLNLKAGHYVLLCNVGDHYMEGMHKDFTVS